RQPLLVDPPRDLAAQECLGGVVDSRARPEGAHHVAAAGTEVVLVDDEQRRAELLGQRAHRHTGPAPLAGVVAGGVARPDVGGRGWAGRAALVGACGGRAGSAARRRLGSARGGAAGWALIAPAPGRSRRAAPGRWPAPGGWRSPAPAGRRRPARPARRPAAARA